MAQKTKKISYIKKPMARNGFICLGLAALLFNQLNTSAYQYAAAGKISIYNYLSIIFSAVFGSFLWNEHLILGTGIGIALILTGAALSFWSGREDRRS